MNPLHRVLPSAAVLLASALVLAGLDPVVPPPLLEAQEQPATPAEAALVLPIDRDVARVLAVAEDAFKEKDWARGLQILQSLHDGKEDCFISVARPGPDQKPILSTVSCWTEVNRLIGSLPADARAEYDKLFAGPAADLLKEARRKNSADLLAQVARRYFHTPAGREAAEQLGVQLSESGEHASAVLQFEKLLARPGAGPPSPLILYRAALSFARSGDRQRAEELWKQIEPEARKAGGLKLGNDLVPLNKLQEQLKGSPAPATVADWPMFRGGPTRTEQAPGGAPFLEPIWTVSTLPTGTTPRSWIDDHLTLATRYWQEQRKQPILPAFFPVAVKDMVVYRTYDGIYALDLKKEGKAKWWHHTDGGITYLCDAGERKAHLDSWNGFYRSNGPHEVIYENSITGTLSTDGARVYAVDDLILPPHPFTMRNITLGAGRPAFGSLNDMVNVNSLKAINLASGKLMWQLGGRFGEKSDLSESFFLGPPLPLGGKLYVLSEKNSELRLSCLEPKDTDKQREPPVILWSQTLALPKDRIHLDLNRRFHAASLAYGNGILVCPTNAGAVLGIDLASRTLLWAYFYREEDRDPNPVPPRVGLRRVFNPQLQVELHTQWKVSAPAIVGNCVIFTAPDARSIHCIRLRDGAAIWKDPRQSDDLYFAGVFAGKVLIVGKSHARALNLADGKEAWRIDDTGTPSGQGTAADDIYYLPLQFSVKGGEPEVCAIDVRKGKVVSRTRAREKGIPGNLVFHRGEVLSQALRSISSYPTVKNKIGGSP
jgi:outer membrane protein assembly factor BamB